LCNFYYEYAIDQANQLNAKQVIPFGANLVYKDSARSALNMECKTPLDFETYVRRTRGENEALKFKAIFGGDVIVKEQGALVIKSIDLYDEQTYRDKMQEFLDSVINDEKLNECRNIDQQIPLLPSLKIKNPTIYDHYICVCHGESKGGIMINTKNSKTAELDFNFLKSNNFDYHLINIKNPLIFHEWLGGRVTIEQVIGSREFTLYRSPNIYNKDVLRIVSTEI
jgi:hypothetical protein